MCKFSVKQGIVFNQYETLSNHVAKKNSYIVRTTISVAGLAISLMGLFGGVNLLTGLGVIVSVAGFFPEGTVIEEYNLTASWTQYVTRSNGTIKYSYAYKQITTTGLYSSDSGNHWVDEGGEFVYYNPSESLFESYEAQFTEAINNYNNSL